MPDPIFDAIEKGNIALIKQLLDANPDLINARKPYKKDQDSLRDNGNQTPLHEACCCEKIEKTAIVCLLLERGADIKALDGQQRTPLHTAARFGANECAEILLEAGAQVDALDMGGRSPLHKACWHWRDSKSIEQCDNYQKTVALLVSKKANPNLPDKFHGKPSPWDRWPVTTPLQDAIESGEKEFAYQKYNCKTGKYENTTNEIFGTEKFKGLDEAVVKIKHKELLQALEMNIEPELYLTTPTFRI